MAGHNKWSKIKHKKGLADVKKSRQFSLLAKIISLESRRAGGNRQSPGLKTAIERAKNFNLPVDNIERAIAGGRAKDSADLEEVIYEAYGPGGVAFIIEGITDNKNRTTAGIKHLLAKHEAALQVPGATLWAFDKNIDGGWQAKTPMPTGQENRGAIKNLISALFDHDDVKNVYTNTDLTL